ncbi:cobalt-precorrin-6A reductase [Rhodococcoides corynebacterioides]|uniref:Cobalt-precorrin-6A reductase n=1 Tax=Rhodococcoides corynebacterioides TaxID=53972 RepID=A0ABS7P2J6_9NOCA|nr:cobalt-precorrin-6A reductase [Rhodococcus corynebacterioides]MBY6366112.1 cobalt-precorrin-6A reductase [Rhodococcus corynebacterioides]MBY6406930.1 cobalt-precorrin-6A reductase [Rhodococcus corynebacterioides]
MHVLLLGGTSEARQLAAALNGRRGIEVTSSLAGRVADPALPVGQVRSGGFGGVDGLRTWLREHEVTHLVDATHPYAETMTRHAVQAAAEESVPLMVLHRAPWTPLHEDRWIDAPSMADAAAVIADHPEWARVLLTIGRQGVHHFADLDDREFTVRCIDPPEDPMPPRTTVLAERGPFDLDSERELFARIDADVLVTKNSGGKLTSAKLRVARERGLPVVMVQRPPLPDGTPFVSTVAECERWVLTTQPVRSARTPSSTDET